MSAGLHLSIPQPCHESWQAMTPKDRGRHCSSCEKIVVDFTLMSDQEVLRYMREATASVCGRFNNHQLNKSYSDVKPRQPFAFAYGWSVVVGAMLLSAQPASARQGEVMLGMVVPEVVKKEKPFWSIANAINKPTFREMVWVYAEKHPSVGEALESVVLEAIETTGVILLEPSSIKGDIMVVEEPGIPEDCPVGEPSPTVMETSVANAGIDTSALAVDVESLIVRDIFLEQEVQEPDATLVLEGPIIGEATEVAIDGSICEGVWMGKVAVQVTDTKAQQVKRTFADWLPGKKAIKAYPNPVSGGGTVKVSIDIRLPGAYRLELLDASGRRVYVQAVQVVQSPQVLTLTTQSSWAHGMYWLRVVSQGNSKVYQSKLVIQ